MDAYTSASKQSVLTQSRVYGAWWSERTFSCAASGVASGVGEYDIDTLAVPGDGVPDGEGAIDCEYDEDKGGNDGDVVTAA